MRWEGRQKAGGRWGAVFFSLAQGPWKERTPEVRKRLQCTSVDMGDDCMGRTSRTCRDGGHINSTKGGFHDFDILATVLPGAK